MPKVEKPSEYAPRLFGHFIRGEIKLQLMQKELKRLEAVWLANKRSEQNG